MINEIDAKIEVNLGNDLAKIAYYALKPDIDKAPKSNLLIKSSYDKDKLIISIKGEDISRLRAGMNSYLRLINLIINTINSLSNKE
ncbi:MAG: KEOPS complex subunit Pcc1 [Nitrososphaerales archaeon]